MSVLFELTTQSHEEFMRLYPSNSKAKSAFDEARSAAPKSYAVYERCIVTKEEKCFAVSFKNIVANGYNGWPVGSICTDFDGSQIAFLLTGSKARHGVDSIHVS